MIAYVLTGVSRGLGKELFNQLVDKQDSLLIVLSECFLPEQRARHTSSSNLIMLEQDFADSAGLSATLDHLTQQLDAFFINKIVFINNAGVINPIGTIGSFSHQSIIDAYSINTIAPALITNYLFAQATKRSCQLSIINVSSGAATKALDGWALYCSGKASMKMFFDVAQVQSNNKGLAYKVISYDPGVMDTAMQTSIRTATKEQCNIVEHFIDLHKNEQLQHPAIVAQKISEML